VASTSLVFGAGTPTPRCRESIKRGARIRRSGGLLPRLRSRGREGDGFRVALASIGSGGAAPGEVRVPSCTSSEPSNRPLQLTAAPVPAAPWLPAGRVGGGSAGRRSVMVGFRAAAAERRNRWAAWGEIRASAPPFTRKSLGYRSWHADCRT